VKCDCIIPVWNQLELTTKCIEALAKNTRYPYRLILIDNGSDADTKRYLENTVTQMRAGGARDLIDAIVIRNEENAGFVKAANQGMKISDAPYVCVLNNDTIPAAGWLEEMVEFAERHEDIGLINPQCNGHGTMAIDDYAKVLAKERDAYMEMNQCQGFCMLIKRALIKKIGFFDESFGMGGFDDTDYSMRAHRAGFRCASMKAAYVYHRLHGSFDVSGDRESWVRRNQEIYYDKWGKHARIGIVLHLTPKEDHGAIARTVVFAYGLAREWSWVHLWINSTFRKDEVHRIVEETLKKEGLAPHQNMRLDCFDLPRPVFGIMLTAKILERLRKRMRDKKFDAVIGFDEKSVSSLRPALALAKSAAIVVDSGNDDWLRQGKETALSIKASRAGAQ